MRHIKVVYSLFFVFLNTQNIRCEIPLCISLGGSCGTALNLRDLKIRTEAYPFDWIVSSFDALYNALVGDFEFFLTNLQLRPDKTGVIDHYGFHFTHDWPTVHNNEFDYLNTDFVGACVLYKEWELALPLVREKYKRRIERFRKICLGQRKVFFIRSGTNQNEAIILRDFFKNKYPKLNFILIVFSNDLSFVQSWNIPYIVNFYSNQWYDPVGWGIMLKKIGPEFKDLIIEKTIRSSESELYCHCCLLKKAIEKAGVHSTFFNKSQ